MKTSYLIAISSLILLGSALASFGETVQTNTNRVGIYNSRSVALAFGRSKTNNAIISKLMEEAKQAKATGDTNKLEQLKKEGSGRQDRLHRQVFGDAPIDDILDGPMKAVIPEIKKNANVSKLMPKAPNDPTLQTVDVTAEMVNFFDPTPETRKMIEDISKHPPLKANQFPLKD